MNDEDGDTIHVHGLAITMLHTDKCYILINDLYIRV